MKTLLDFICPSIEDMRIDKLSSLHCSFLKILAVGINCVLRGSSEHQNMLLENLTNISCCEATSAKFIDFNPASMVQKTYKGHMNRVIRYGAGAGIYFELIVKIVCCSCSVYFLVMVLHGNCVSKRYLTVSELRIWEIDSCFLPPIPPTRSSQRPSESSRTRWSHG